MSNEDDGYEGWFWTKADSLKAIWFEDGQKERHDEVYTWDEQSRPVHLDTSCMFESDICDQG